MKRFGLWRSAGAIMKVLGLGVVYSSPTTHGKQASGIRVLEAKRSVLFEKPSQYVTPVTY